MTSFHQETALEAASDAGIDLSLLDSNLALTPEERVLRHEAALALMRALRQAAAQLQHDERLSTAVRETF